jgi:ABC-type multidrug transport system fused ATPase/permease subunit
MHYNLAQYDLVSSHKALILRGLKEKKTILRMIFYSYRRNIVEYTAFGVVSAIIGFTSTFFLANIIKIVGATTKDSNSNRDLVINFVLMGVLTSLSSIFWTYYQFKSQRLSFNIRCSIIQIVADKVLKYSTLTSKQINEGQITNYFQVDINRISALLFILLNVITGATSSIISLIYLCTLVEVKIVAFLMGGFLLLLTIYFVIYYFRTKYLVATLEKKDQRMGYLRNVLLNIESVKIRALENFFSFKLFERREEEIRYLKKTAVVISDYQSNNNYPRFLITIY